MFSQFVEPGRRTHELSYRNSRSGWLSMQFLFYYCYKYCRLGSMSFTRRRDEKLYLRYIWARISEPSLSPVYTQRSGSHQLSVFLDYRAISIHTQTQLGSACLKSALSLFLFAEKKMITRLACGHCLHFLMHMLSLNQSSSASLPPTYFKEIILRKDTNGLHLVQWSGYILLFLISTLLEIINVSLILECWVCFANSHLSFV